MKSQRSSMAVWKMLVTAIAVMALAALAGTALAAAAPNEITVHDQDLSSGVIVIDSVNAAQDGWIVIYKNPNFTSGEIVGYAPVHQGSNKDVKVTIDTAKVGDLPTLWAMLHADSGLPGVFEWGYKGKTFNDTPVSQNGQPVVASFGTAASMAAATTTSAPAVPAASAPAAPAATQAPATTRPVGTTGPIVIADQDLNSGVVVASSVNSPVDGWVVAYKDPNNFTSGQLVGYAPVHQGANNDVRITLDTAKVGDLPTLWAVLQADMGIPGRFEWGWKGQAYDDAPIVQNGHNIVTGFGTAAAQAAATTAATPVVSATAQAAPVATQAPATSKPAATAGPIVVKNQDLGSGVVMLDSVTAPQDGWAVVYKNPNLTAGEIVGYAPVHQGANKDVKVTLDTAKIGNAPTLWVVLHADQGLPGVFEWGWRGRPFEDSPLLVNGHEIVAAFGTAANQ